MRTLRKVKIRTHQKEHIWMAHVHSSDSWEKSMKSDRFAMTFRSQITRTGIPPDVVSGECGGKKKKSSVGTRKEKK